MWAIVGGSGFEKFEGFKPLENLSRETPFGLCSSGLKKVEVAGQEVLFLSRHGENHELLPSEVNYRANIFALKKYGARAILSFSAVGSLHQEYKPGDMVVPTQYLDRTKGLRAHSFCGQGLVGHMSLAHPVCRQAVSRLQELMSQPELSSWDSHFCKTYVCIEGPNFSTQAESNSYRQMGAHIIGMTNYPEYALAREAGLTYLPCGFVTDYDCWDDNIPHVTLSEVLEVMRKNNAKAFKVAEKVVSTGPDLYQDCQCKEEGLKNGVMTPEAAWPEATREWLSILRS